MHQKLVEVGRDDGPLSQATSKEGDALCMSPQPRVKIPECTLQEVFLSEDRVFEAADFYL